MKIARRKPVLSENRRSKSKIDININNIMIIIDNIICYWWSPCGADRSSHAFLLLNSIKNHWFIPFNVGCFQVFFSFPLFNWFRCPGKFHFCTDYSINTFDARYKFKNFCSKIVLKYLNLRQYCVFGNYLLPPWKQNLLGSVPFYFWKNIIKNSLAISSSVKSE